METGRFLAADVMAHNKQVLYNKWKLRLNEIFAISCLEDLDFVSFVRHILTQARRQRSITNWTIVEDDRFVRFWIEAFEDCEFSIEFTNVPPLKPKIKENWKEGF